MASNYKGAMSYVKPIEGGYCVGVECGSANSGETYKGIDRKFHPSWKGWTYIDQYKKQYGRPAWNKHFDKGTLAPLIQGAVEDFYQSFWEKKGLANINNQLLASLVFAFIVHRENAGIATLNSLAKKLGAKSLRSTSITPDAANYIEKNIISGYANVRAAIINHYNNLKSGATYIKNRVTIFPASISSATVNQAAKKPTNVIGWIAALFGLSKFF